MHTQAPAPLCLVCRHVWWDGSLGAGQHHPGKGVLVYSDDVGVDSTRSRAKPEWTAVLLLL